MNARLVVADNCRARIFESHLSLRDLKKVDDLVHTPSRLTNRDLVDDASGKSVDQHGSLEPATSPKDHEKIVFAKRLGKHLKKMHSQKHFDELVLVAPPKFLGMLRDELQSPLDKLVTRTVDKDLTRLTVHELVEVLKI